MFQSYFNLKYDMYLLNVELENTALNMMMIALQDHDDEHISTVDNNIHGGRGGGVVMIIKLKCGFCFTSLLAGRRIWSEWIEKVNAMFFKNV